jgi:hypothetical protein
MDVENQKVIILGSYGAGNGARTRGIKLGKLALYQLSYARTDSNFKLKRGNRQYVMGNR